MDGNSSLDGRVEVLKGGIWGTICGRSHFSIVEGSIICRQLGFFGASEAFNFAHYPPASNNTPIVLLYMFCIGDEAQLDDCFSGQYTYSTQYCTHQDDVGVVCLGEPM